MVCGLITLKYHSIFTEVSIFSTFRYSVMAGTPAKMVEYLLETRIDKTCSFDGKSYLSHCAVEISYNTSARESAELIKQRYVFLRRFQNSVK